MKTLVIFSNQYISDKTSDNDPLDPSPSMVCITFFLNFIKNIKCSIFQLESILDDSNEGPTYDPEQEGNN